ncbi:MAG: hypothetical protein ACYDFU_04000 [Nitrospirota bacterium]
MSVKLVKTVVLLAVSAFAVGVFAASAMAQAPKLTLKMKAEKEVKVLKNGKETVELKPAKTTNMGDVLLYTITYTNIGDSEAANAVISDPIPENAVYLGGSARGAGAVVAFSIDKGKTFHKTPKQVVAGVEKAASPEAYTNIRWTIRKIAPKESGSVSFKARVK